MASDCGKCHSSPCICGLAYKDWSLEARRRLADAVMGEKWLPEIDELKKDRDTWRNLAELRLAQIVLWQNDAQHVLKAMGGENAPFLVYGSGSQNVMGTLFYRIGELVSERNALAKELREFIIIVDDYRKLRDGN